MTIRLAVDAEGGDHGIFATVPAGIRAVSHYDDLHIVFVGKSDAIVHALGPAVHNKRISVVHADEVVGMDELPSQALRKKKQSSMRIALDLVQRGEANGCVSAGNTGALMATARFVLKTLDGIDRPAICTALPTIHGRTYMLDLGANIDSSGEQLLQFALMGAELVTAQKGGTDKPTVGLLNVGTEEIKGKEVIRQAHDLLHKSDLRYIGFVEGNDVFTKAIDVIVCDGFEGNIALKTSEGAARMMAHYLRTEFERAVWTKAIGILAKPILKRFRARVDPRKYNGASLIGLKHVVVKSHGSADAFAFLRAIHEARIAVKEDVPRKIGVHIERLAAG